MRFLKRSAIALVLTVLVAMLSTNIAAADSGHRDYLFLLGVAPIEGPDEAMAPNGDIIVITGEGSFSIHPKSISGGGTFTHMDAAGNVLGSGTWTATELLAFHSYGSGSVQGLPPEFEGGLALMRIELVPAGTSLTFEGILQVHCLLGDQIPAGAHEGIRLNLQGINFNQEVEGETVFIRQ